MCVANHCKKTQGLITISEDEVRHCEMAKAFHSEKCHLHMFLVPNTPDYYGQNAEACSAEPREDREERNPKERWREKSRCGWTNTSDTEELCYEAFWDEAKGRGVQIMTNFGGLVGSGAFSH